MSTAAAIPESEHKNILNMYAKGDSTRKIAEILKSRDIEASHGAVWRLIQRIGESSGNLDVASAVADLRHQSGDDVEVLLDLENRVFAAAEFNPDDDIRLDHVLKRVRVLEIAHRMRCNRLRASGVFGVVGNNLHKDFAHVWAEVADEEERIREQEQKAKAVAVTPAANAEVLRVTAPIQQKTSKIRRNSPPAVTPEPAPANDVTAPTPARTRPCPCGSGMKYKRCCALKEPERKKCG